MKKGQKSFCELALKGVKGVRAGEPEIIKGLAVSVNPFVVSFFGLNLLHDSLEEHYQAISGLSLS